jgi:hypothetical protein
VSPRDRPPHHFYGENTDQQANNEMFPKRKNEMRQKKIIAGFARYQVWFHKQHLKNIF